MYYKLSPTNLLRIIHRLCAKVNVNIYWIGLYWWTMCRMVGYLGGIVLFLVLGIEKLKGYEYFFATAILNLIALLLVIVFRILAKWLNGFWKIWCKRLQKQISLALACLSHYTELPEYEITTVTVDGYGNKSVSKSTTSNTLIWGCIECAVCVILTGIAPLIVAFILFCYAEATYHECQYRSDQKVKNQKKQEQIARQSARMTLGIPFNSTFSSPYTRNDSNLSNNSNGIAPNPAYHAPPSYPMMETTVVKKTYVHTVYMPNTVQMEMQEQISPNIQPQMQFQYGNQTTQQIDHNQTIRYQKIEVKREGETMTMERVDVQVSNINNDEL